MTTQNNNTNLENVISRTAFLLERLQEDVSRLGESVDGTNQTVARLEDKLEHVATLAADIPAIKAAVTDQTVHMAVQDDRIGSLETAA